MFESMFRDRRDAAETLAAELSSLDLPRDTAVLGLARGGVPVSREVADRLELDHDVFVVRKLGVPYQPELAFGAIATGDVRILNDDIVRAASVSERTIERVTDQEREILDTREQKYRQGRPPLDLTGRTVVLVDDGMATGATMAVAVDAIRRQEPVSVIAAVPVASRRSYNRLAGQVDELVCLATPDPFMGVGAWYDDFSQTTDDDVRQLLEE